MSVYLLLMALAAACALEPPQQRAALPAQPLPTINPDTLGTYVAPPPLRSFPATADEVQSWIDSLDLPSIRAHGWDLWESINTPVDTIGTPAWETWYSGHELFELGPTARDRSSAGRDFETPAQFHANSSPGFALPAPVPSERVTAFNRYTAALANAIWGLGLNEVATLNAINAEFDANNTPTAERKIAAGPIDPQSIALKPVFQFISGSEPTVIPYWAGIATQATTDLANPEPHTWRQGVVVDPTGTLDVGSTVSMPVNDEPPAPRLVVPLSAFYTVLLTQDDVDNFSKFALESGDDLGENNQGDPGSVAAMVKVGNIAVLVAMHMTTKEIDNWTWQTFWWANSPDDPFYGADRPDSIPAPWSNYNMQTAYFMVVPPDSETGEPYTAFNPYLETNLTGTVSLDPARSVYWTGVDTNCMSCHRMAAWSQNAPNSPAYRPGGQIDPGDPAFEGYTKLDFLWSLTRAQ